MVTRIGSQQMARNFLSDLGKTQVAIADLQRQLSTGKRVSDPSDDPVGVALALNLRDDVQSVQAWKTNVEDSKSWLSATDDALGNFESVIQRAHELTVQGANGSLALNQRAMIGDEILALRDQIVETGNASFGGRYLFGGTQTNRAPMDPAGPGLTAPPNTNTLNREVGQGQVMSVNVTADRLVDPPGATPDIFTTLTTIGNALKAGDVTTASNVGIAELDVHIANVNSLRGEVGTKINRLELTSSRFDIDDIARQSQLSSIEDADIAKTVMDLQMRQNVLQGSLAVGARVMQRSLVDFIS
ncbi:MAG: flagellar hook-associated protein FlgL [Thermoleophilia bacterium]